MDDEATALDWYPEPIGDVERETFEQHGEEGVRSLAQISQARRMLAEAKGLDDIRAVRDMALVARRAAEVVGLSRESVNEAAEIQIRAERMAGEALAAMRKHGGGRPKETDSSAESVSKPLRLTELGIRPKDSMHWQAAAAIPEPVFEQHIAETKAAGASLTTAGVVQVARQIEKAERAAEPKPIINPETVPARIECGNAARMHLPSDSVHLIVTSPPYGVGIDYPNGDVAPSDWPKFMYCWLAEAHRVAAPGGRLALNVPLDTVIGGHRPTYAEAVRAAVEAGWRYRSTILWADNELGKSTARGSVDSASSPYIYAGAEPIALFSKGPWRRQPPCPSDIDHADWVAWTNGLWRFRGDQVPWEGHPAPFPLELPRRLILLLSFPGDVVLDPFVGSGTTTLAALHLGRQAIGFDRSQQYVDSTLRRLAALGGGGRSGAVGAPSAGASLSVSGEGKVLPGGLCRWLHRGADRSESPEHVQAGRAGVTV